MTEVLLAAACLVLAGALIYLRGNLKFQEAEVRRLQDAEQQRVELELTTLEREQRRSGEILERMDEGVLVLDEALVPIKATAAARALLHLGQGRLPARVPSEEVLSVARRALSSQGPTEQTISLWPAQSTLRIRALPLEDPAGVAVLFQDVTEELRTMRIRRQFVANASHELKSPVASLQALGEAIGEAARDDPETAIKFAAKLTSETERLSRLIADLLDLSKLEDPINLAARDTNLTAVGRRQLAEIHAAAQAKDLSIVERLESAVLVRGDEQQLGLMLRNLLDNAVKYTPDGGAVSVEIFCDGSDAVARVSDTGIGIPLNAQSRVFERFYRVDKDRSRSSGGTGLGLSIVKHVVELHGGYLGLESQLGEGSTFTVRLPALGERSLRSVAS
ncbi:MAG TPA: ATP-binding protein [Actinomycetota bacterium]|nr:ATP-binding protein [Actinomycetota bacterium]